MTEKLSLEEKFSETGGKRPYVQRLFARIARIYDPMNRLMSFGLDRRWRAFAAAHRGRAILWPAGRMVRRGLLALVD